MGKSGRIQRQQQLQIKAKHRASTSTQARLGVAFYVICLLLVISTLGIYWQVTKNPLINCDDRDYVTNNVIVKAGLTAEGVKWAFNVGSAGNWHPLTWLSHMLDSTLFGPEAPAGKGPGMRHLVSLILHVANTLLLFLVLTRFTGYMWRSAFVAALFALHPQHVESVAWVAERKDVLSTFFMMLTLLTYWWYVRKPGVIRYILVALTFAIGLMAKPMLVTVPVLLLVLDFWPLRRFENQLRGKWQALILEKAPLFVLSIISSVLTIKAQSSVGAVSSFAALPMTDRLNNAAMSSVIYITKMFWPVRLGNYYTYPKLGWPAAEVAGALIFIIAMSILAIRCIKTRPYLLSGWLWYIISLVPVIGIMQVGSQARADRYTYVPLIGLFVIIAYVAPDMLRRFIPSKALGALAVITIAALSVVTFEQIGYWRDGITLAKRAIAVTDNNWFEMQSLGSQLQDEAERMGQLGKSAEATAIAGEAAIHLKESIRLAPDCADAHNDLGRAYALTGDFKNAEIEYLDVFRINPNHVLAHNNLGNTYLAVGRPDDAIAQYEWTLRLDPRNIFATYNMAIAFQIQGRSDESIEQYLQVLQLQPNQYFAYWARFNAAFFLQKKNKMAQAEQLLNEAVQINQSTPVPIDPTNRARIVLSRGKP